MTDHNNQMNVSFFLIAGFFLFVSIFCVVIWVATIQVSSESGGFLPAFRSNRSIRLPATPVVEESSAEAALPVSASGNAVIPNQDAVIAAITKGGCVACHTIPNIPGAVGQIGPNLSNIGVDGANRRDGYSAQEYIHESIADPLAFTAPDCPTGPCIAGAMPPLLLEDAEIDVIVSYLVTLKGGDE